VSAVDKAVARCDRAHFGCTGAGVRDLVRDVMQVRPELGERLRRGRRRAGDKLPIVYVGICTACGQPRVLAYPPREMPLLPFESAAPRAARARSAAAPAAEGAVRDVQLGLVGDAR